MTHMARNIGRLGPQRGLAFFADWTDRIAAGELPASQPPRPQGVERNVVVTLWDWAGPKAYLHDEIATDKRDPTVNANGRSMVLRRRAPISFRSSIRSRRREFGEDAGAGSEYPLVEGRPARDLPVLGRRADLGQPNQHA